MANKTDQTALGALNILAQGFASAHQADLNFRIAELDNDFKTAQLEEETSQRSLQYAMQVERDAKNDYNTKLKSLDQFKIKSEEITSAGTGLIKGVFEDGKLNLEQITNNTDVWSDRTLNIGKVKNQINNQLQDYAEYSNEFSGESGILNPNEFNKFKDFALKIDDKNTEVKEGLGYSKIYGDIGTAGLDYQYSKLGFPSQIATQELTQIGNLISKEQTKGSQNYEVLRTFMTPVVDDDKTDKENAEVELALATQLGFENSLTAFRELRSAFSVNDFKDGLNHLYNTNGSDALLENLRTNSKTKYLFEDMEKSYKKVSNLNLELNGTNPKNNFDNSIVALDNAETLDDALSMFRQFSQTNPSKSELKDYGNKIQNMYRISEGDFIDSYNSIYNPNQNDLNSPILSNVSKKDDVLLDYSQNTDRGKANYIADSVREKSFFTKDGIDALAIFNALDKYTLPSGNREDIELYLKSLLNKDSSSYNPSLATIITKAYKSDVFMTPMYTPANNIQGLPEDPNAMQIDAVSSISSLFGLNSEAQSYNPGTIAGEVIPKTFLIGDATESRYLKKKNGDYALTFDGDKILAEEYWKGDDQQGWSLANSFGMGKLNTVSETAFFRDYNNSMESLFDQLVGENDYQGLDIFRTSSFIPEKNIGARIKASFGQDAYDKAHKISQEIGKESQILEIKRILEKGKGTKYNALIDVLNNNRLYVAGKNMETINKDNTFDDHAKALDSMMSLTRGNIGGGLKQNIGDKPNFNREEFAFWKKEWDKLSFEKADEYKTFSTYLMHMLGDESTSGRIKYEKIRDMVDYLDENKYAIE